MFSPSRTVFILGLLPLFIHVFVSAETHTVRFDNGCGRGSPRLIQKGNVLSSGEDFVSAGPLSSAIANFNSYLVLKADIPAGNCLLNGEGCTLVEMTLVNPTCPGCGSSTDISLIPPLAFSVPVTFSYFGGCNGQGATCSSAKCNTAFFVPDDNQVQVACQENNVNLLITFCGGSGNTTVPSSSTAIAAPSTTASKVSSKPATPTAKKCNRTRAERRAALRARNGLQSHRRRAIST
ncbi:hypothetical protein K443DRAFT_82298 [Laccaria amethystina LaAM-08-1]|uniref:Glycopeptide n=1 Tax=Laccaria amethystina LaAM-08-1 TaxID=1095629 RepID=A0A0C9YHE2_9AGAR|nr:hypothetical protein K443DRAFT_82298 [Laccaria amethystina LaAM-08-1]